MKTAKKLLCVFLVCALAFSCVWMWSAAASSDGSLKFKNGKFKILVLSDIHEDGQFDDVWTDELAFINAALDSAEPDLVVFNGDNVITKGVENTRAGIDKIVAPVEARGIPFAVVFGNHDHEPGVSREEQMAMYRAHSNCLAIEGEDLTGCGNYNLLVYSANGATPKFNLWFIDSLSSDAEKGGYDYVHADQIEWYEKTCEQLKTINGGKVIPAALFQHICVPEEYDLLTPSVLPRIECVKGHGTYSNRFWVKDKSNSTLTGSLREGPCPSDTNSGQFASWVKMGDVKLAVFGHDHTNTFAGELQGITLMQAGGAGFRAYSDPLTQVGSLITIDESTLGFTRELVAYSELVGQDPLSYEFEDYFGFDFWWSFAKFDFATIAKMLYNAFKYGL